MFLNKYIYDAYFRDTLRGRSWVDHRRRFYIGIAILVLEKFFLEILLPIVTEVNHSSVYVISLLLQGL